MVGAAVVPLRAAATRSTLHRVGCAAGPALSVAQQTRPIGLRAASRAAPRIASVPASIRGVATTASTAYASASHVASEVNNKSYKVVVVGGGTAGQDVSHILAKSGFFDTSSDAPASILVIDPAQYHDYQPGWTLVGGGVRTAESGRRNLPELTLAPGVDHLADAVTTFDPENNSVTTKGGATIGYDQLVVAPGLKTNWDAIQGLSEALAQPDSGVVSIYGFKESQQVFPAIQALKKGQAIFTQPAGVIKCAGAPQKVLWMALDHWKRENVFSPTDPTAGVKVSFLTGTPTMFAVPKYSAVLDQLRQERQVEGLFKTNLVKVDAKNKVATFAQESGQPLEREFDLLHVSPPMGPLDFIKNSPLAAEQGGFVDVDSATTQHNKYKNVWSLGDSSSLPTSKTAAAITAQAPVTVANLLHQLALPNQSTTNSGTQLPAAYDGYTSCPLITEYGKVLLAEFKYGGQPKETFAKVGIDQGHPSRLFWHLKKDFFPRVYYSSMVNGTWGGAQGWLDPKKLAPPRAS